MSLEHKADREIPCLVKNGKKSTLYVDGRPFRILGGELHNSSGSSLEYLQNRVWPGLRALGGNCYLTPVYWECLEPEPGKYDFTLVDGVIAQARQEGVRLVFLWFGLWKNGSSSYVPAWMKLDPSYFYVVGVDGKLLESVSPFCEKAVEADKKAFTALLEHLGRTDLERTVIMLQVENEVGVWGQPRDYSEPAREAFSQPIPAEIADLLGQPGYSGLSVEASLRREETPEDVVSLARGLSWEEAFGTSASEYFMAWAYASAVEKIAAAGKEIYPLPMFMNCVPHGMGLSELAGSCPSGGPVVRALPIWRKLAPSIDLYGPDIYSPHFKEIAGSFAAENTFVLPETGSGKDCVSKALYTVAAYDTLCFSPFGIDGMLCGSTENDLLSEMNIREFPPAGDAGEQLAEAYRLLTLLGDTIDTAREEGRICAFLEEGPGEEFVLKDYRVHVTYKGVEAQDGATPMPGMGPKPDPSRDTAPIGGGFILREEGDRFLICGVSANITFLPAYAAQERVFILDKRELALTDTGLVPVRILNGDERNHLVLGSKLTIQEISFYHRSNL